MGAPQGNGRKQLPGQAPSANSGSLPGSADSAVPQSWVAMRSDEGEVMHRLRHDEGTPVSLAGIDLEAMLSMGSFRVHVLSSALSSLLTCTMPVSMVNQALKDICFDANITMKGCLKFLGHVCNRELVFGCRYFILRMVLPLDQSQTIRTTPLMGRG